MCSSMDGWQFVVEKRGVRVFQRSADGVHHLKGITTLPFSARQAWPRGRADAADHGVFVPHGPTADVELSHP